MNTLSQLIFSAVVTSTLLVACTTTPHPVTEQNEREPDLGPPKVIEPQIARRIVERLVPKFGNFEVGAWGGQMAMEGISTNPSFGISTGFYFSEDFFFRIDAGKSTVSRSDYPVTLQQLNTENQLSFEMQSLSLAYNFLPGEAYLGRNKALNSNFYIIGGVGFVRFPIVGIASPTPRQTTSQNNSQFAQNFGAGFKIFPTDHLNINMEVGNRMYSSNIPGYSKSSSNLEMRIGINFVY